MTNREYSVVLTSCGRFDLLRRTLESFAAFADIAPRQFIIVEDSGSDEVRGVLAGIDLPFEVVVTPRLGQARAIDAGYARVKTPFVFHCEDDWEFFRAGFVAESFVLLESLPTASTVLLRGREEEVKLHNLKGEEINGVKFFRPPVNLDRLYWGYSYNPGLRRMADYRRIAPVARIGGEAEVSFVFKRLGFTTAHLETPAVYHIGWDRHVSGPKPPRANFFRRKLRRLRDKTRILRWQIFGLPVKADNGNRWDAPKRMRSDD